MAQPSAKLAFICITVATGEITRLSNVEGDRSKTGGYLEIADPPLPALCKLVDFQKGFGVSAFQSCKKIRFCRKEPGVVDEEDQRRITGDEVKRRRGILHRSIWIQGKDR